MATTQDELKDIEDRLAVFGQLKAKLGELQSRLVPLEAGDGGVLSSSPRYRTSATSSPCRSRASKRGEGGDLAERVKTFTDAKRELEERVSMVTDHFSQVGDDAQGSSPACSTS